MAAIIIIVIIVLIAIVFVVSYNGLVRLRNRIDSAWSQIGVQLERRQAKSAGPEQQAQAENVLTGALKSLFALAEAYPDLKANQNFLSLQEELTATEDRIAYSRQFYNDSVMKYDNKIQSIPSNLIAGMFGFTSREYFKADDTATEVPRVQF